jgi:hypothetical protein
VILLVGAALAAKGHLVIVEGDRERERAELEERMWHAEGWPVSGDWPKLLHSDEIEGLKPGFWILALGFYESPESAQAMVAYIHSLGGAAYPREVELDLPYHHNRSSESAHGMVVWDSVKLRQAVLGQAPANADGLALLPTLPDARGTALPAEARCTSDKGAIYLDNGAWGEATSEDWAWFSDDVATAAKKAGVHVGNRAQWVVDRCDDTTVKLEKQQTVGYWVVKPGAQPLWIQHDMTDSVLSQASAYLGLQLSRE